MILALSDVPNNKRGFSPLGQWSTWRLATGKTGGVDVFGSCYDPQYVTGMSYTARTWLKRFAATVPAFKADPHWVVTVDADGVSLEFEATTKYVHQKKSHGAGCGIAGSEHYRIRPSLLGLDPATLEAGQRIHVDLKN